MVVYEGRLAENKRTIGELRNALKDAGAGSGSPDAVLRDQAMEQLGKMEDVLKNALTKGAAGIEKKEAEIAGGKKINAAQLTTAEFEQNRLRGELDQALNSAETDIGKVRGEVYTAVKENVSMKELADGYLNELAELQEQYATAMDRIQELEAVAGGAKGNTHYYHMAVDDEWEWDDAEDPWAERPVVNIAPTPAVDCTQPDIAPAAEVGATSVVAAPVSEIPALPQVAAPTAPPGSVTATDAFA